MAQFPFLIPCHPASRGIEGDESWAPAFSRKNPSPLNEVVLVFFVGFCVVVFCFLGGRGV